MFSSAAALDRAVLDPAEEVPVAELGRRIVAGTAGMSSFQATWLGLVAAFDRWRGWEADGVHSCAYWLGWRCGIDRRTARAHVAVARALESLPVLRTALAEGRLSYSKVRAVCRVATADNEEFLVDLALNLTATQLDRSIAGYARAHGEPISAADDAERRSQCGATSWVDAAGLHHIEIISSPEDGAVIEMALDFGRDGLYRERKAEAATTTEAAKAAEAARPVDEQEDPTTKPVPVARGRAGRLEALVWVLRRGLVNAQRPGLVDESPFLIMVHVREGAAVVDDSGRIDLGNGLAVHPRTLRRLGCDGLVQAMLEGADGRPLDLGRRIRTATPKQKLALRAMYDSCAFPGCDTDVRYCEFHHLEHWAAGGRSDLATFRPLCRAHHHRVHEGGYRLVPDARGALVALPPNGGAPVVNTPPLTDQAVRAGDLVVSNRAAGRRPADDAAHALSGRWGGEAMTEFALSVIVDGMLAADARGQARREAAEGADGTGGTGKADVAGHRDLRVVQSSPPSPN